MGPKTQSRIIILQKKALRIIIFQSRDSHSNPLFRSNHILKLDDKILIENILLASKSFNNLLPSIFKSSFAFCSNVHNYHSVSSTVDKIFKPSYTTASNGNTPIFNHAHSITIELLLAFLNMYQHGKIQLDSSIH